MFIDDPFAVVSGEFASLLQSAGADVSCNGDDLFFEHEGCAARVEFRPPDEEVAEHGTIPTVVSVYGTLPSAQAGTAPDDEALCVLNDAAALGAAMSEDGTCFAGSRLTVFRGELAWHDLQLPLLAASIINGIRAFGPPARRSATGSRDADSVWTPEDLCSAAAVLSRLSFCTHDAAGLTAEFPLAEGQMSAVVDDPRTAMLTMITDQPHPVLGGGLECLLQMPHQVEDRTRLLRLCNQLNRMEMARLDLPPHFGAWRPGKILNNPTYVSFLPDTLHAVKGIAINVGVWAAHRARWANVALAALGAQAPGMARRVSSAGAAIACQPEIHSDESAATQAEQPPRMDWRPASYWSDDGAGRHTPMNEFERRMEQASATGDWSDCHLPPVPFALRGGDFLPRLRRNEVEIARLSLESTTWDVISIRARRAGKRIAYRVVDEYGTDYKIRPKISARPLTLGQLIALIDGLSDGECDRSPSAMRDDQLIFGDAYRIEEIAGFVEVSSPYYEDLDACYEAEAVAWVEENRAALEALEKRDSLNDDAPR